MPQNTVRSPNEFVKSYTTNSGGTFSERVAEFLNSGADALPKAYFDKRFVAKVAFSLNRIPKEDSDHVKRLSRILSGANQILSRKYHREIDFDRVDGVRATVDDEDLAKTVHRRKRRRVKCCVSSLESTDKNIDSNQLNGDIKREIIKSRRSMKLLQDAIKEMPLLPSKKEI